MSQSSEPVDLEFEAKDKPRAIVAISARWPRILLSSTAVLVVILAGLVFVGAAGDWANRIALLWPIALMLVGLIPEVIMMARGPEFAVLKDGIKVPFNRLSPKRSIWDRRGYGFYSWSEVSYCRWSPYNPGVLSIHLQAAAHHVPVIGADPDAHVKVPPMIYFYRVPERHRAAVESGIRACGKWVD
jgi:hypothetical protein